MKYEVWMGFRDYRGKVYDITKVAAFISKNRAEEYVTFCESTADDEVEYAIVEK